MLLNHHLRQAFSKSGSGDTCSPTCKPAVLGIRWYAGMTKPDSNNYIAPTGELQGGHAIIARGVDYTKKILILRNSWGSSYGNNGDCYLPFDAMTELFKQNGEAVFFIGRKHKTIV